MFRLSVLLLATLVGLGLAMLTLGGEDLRADRRPAPEPARSIAETVAPARPATPTADPETPVEALPQPEQTPETQPRFPGPALEASPEFAGRTPADPAASPTEPTGPALWVTASRLNMRSAPNSGAAVVTGLDGGTRLEPLSEEQAGWINVRAPGGQTGYVSAQFVSDQPQ